MALTKKVLKSLLLIPLTSIGISTAETIPDIPLDRIASPPPSPDNCLEKIPLFRSILETPSLPFKKDEALYNLARAYDLCGKKQDSIDTLRILIERNPRSSLSTEACFRVAESLFDSKKYSESLPFYDCAYEAGTAAPFNGLAITKKAWALRSIGKSEEAIKLFNESLKEGDSSFPSKELMNEVKHNSVSAIGGIVIGECKETYSEPARLLALADSEYAVANIPIELNTTSGTCDKTYSKEKCSCLHNSVERYIKKYRPSALK